MVSNSDRIKIAFVGGHTRRWHAADIVGEERVDSHTWGMLAIIHILHPAPTVALLGAVTFHDSPGELYSGDIPYGAKVAFPALGEADREIGDRANAALGLDYAPTRSEKWWLSFADMAQALLFARRQVAQGNSLMGPIAHNCAECLRLLVNRADAPSNAGGLVDTILKCRVDLPLSRDLLLLESLSQ